MIAVPLLSSCGFDMATDRVYTPAVGANNRDASVDVLAAVIVSTESGSGTVIATFVNNSPDEEASVVGVSGGVQTDQDVAVSVPAQGFVNLADEDADPIKVTGEFAAGDFVEVQFEIGTGELVPMQLPVVRNEGVYADLDGPAPETGEPSFQGPADEEESAPSEPAESGPTAEESE